MQEQTITALRESLAAAGLPFVQDEPLAGHTTFKIGGPAAFWCTPHNAEELRSTLALCRENGARVYLLGNGTIGAHRHKTLYHTHINCLIYAFADCHKNHKRYQKL